MATVNGQVSLSVSPQVYITLTNQRDNSTVELTHFNKWRNSSGGLYLYNEDFSTQGYILHAFLRSVLF